MNMNSGSDRSEKCRWFQLVDEFMSDGAHVVSHPHTSATNPDGPKPTTFSDTNSIAHKSGECTLKPPEPKRRKDVFLEQCFGEIRESSKHLIDSLKASEKMKMTLLLSMQKTMKKLVEKL